MREREEAEAEFQFLVDLSHDRPLTKAEQEQFIKVQRELNLIKAAGKVLDGH